MTWLVTGSEGFIGQALMKAKPDAIGWDLKRGRDAALSVAEWDVDHIVHLAAEAGIQACRDRPAKAFHNNVVSLQNILENARRNKAKAVFASSAAAAGFNVSIYAAHKRACEALCRAYADEYELEVSILRLGNVYGPGSLHKSSAVAAFCKQALQGGPVKVDGDGRQTRDFVHVDDVVTAILHAEPGLWSVSTGHQTEVRTVAQMIADMACVPLEMVPGRANDAGRSQETDFRVRWIDYKPLEDGVRETWEWFRTQGRKSV